MKKSKKALRCSKLKFFLSIFIICTISGSYLAFDIKSYQNRDFSIAKAIFDVITQFYIKNDIKFDLIIYGETTQHINEVITLLLKELSNEQTTEIKHIKQISTWDHKMNKSAVIFVKNSYFLDQLHLRSDCKNTTYDLKLTNDTPKRFKFLLYLQNSNIKNIELILKMQEYNLVAINFASYEFFIIVDKRNLILSANVLYSEEACGKMHLKKLNKFDIKTQKWNKKLENFDHFAEFHGCLMTFVLQIDSNFYSKSVVVYNRMKDMNRKVDSNSLIDPKFDGINQEIMEILASKLNLTAYCMIHSHGFNFKLLNSQTFVADWLQSTLLKVFVDKGKKSNYHWSEPVQSLDFYYLVSLNDLYNNYEKLLMPFDLTTWILLSSTIGLTFIIIFGFKKFPQLIRIFIYEEGRE